MKITSVCLTVGVLLIVLFVTSLTGLEVSLYECPCDGVNCVNDHISSTSPWTSFTYEIEENVTITATVNLQKGASCARSRNIWINFMHPNNQHIYHGQLHGTLDDGETVTIEISEEGVMSLYKNYGFEQFSKSSFCIRRLNETYSSIHTCCGKEKPCLQKCCPYGEAFTNNGSKPCVQSLAPNGWHIPVYKPTNSTLKIHSKFPNCEIVPYTLKAVLSSSLTKYHLPRQPFRLLDDGTVLFLSGDRKAWKVKPDEVDYCVDKLALPPSTVDMTCGDDEQDVLILCSKPHVIQFSKNDWIYRIVYMMGFCVAIIFLFATAIVHFLLLEKQNIHSWTILCYAITLTFFYACLLVIYVEETRKRMVDDYTPYFSKLSCFIIGVVTHFMGVFSFAWLSVINFDLWWTFRILKPMNQRGLDVKRLFCYGGFALAVPTTVVTIAAVFQIKYERRSEPCRETDEDLTIYPLYAEDGCFLANSSQPFYFYIPVGILLLANLIFYLSTSCQMLRIYNATRRISDSNTRKQKQSCELFLKLFLVMGTTWIFQVILSLVEKENDEHKWYSILYVVLDMVNVFQAIAIFIIFVYKRETLRALEQKYSCLKSWLRPFQVSYQPNTGTSRSTDGSTKMSRAELTKHMSIESTTSDPDPHQRRESELINFR